MFDTSLLKRKKLCKLQLIQNSYLKYILGYRKLCFNETNESGYFDMIMIFMGANYKSRRREHFDISYILQILITHLFKSWCNPPSPN